MDRNRPDQSWFNNLAAKTLAGRFRLAPAQKARGSQREPDYSHLGVQWLAAKIAVVIMVVVWIVDWIFF